MAKKKANDELQIITNDDTPHDESDRHYLVDDLTDVHQKAVYMKFMGKDYFFIAGYLKVTYTTVRNWFAKNGVCHNAYQELHEERSKENRAKFKTLNDKIEEYAADALDTLHRVGMHNWKAAESLVHIAGFAPTQKIKAEIETTENDEVAQVIKEIRAHARSVTAAKPQTVDQSDA